MRKFVSCICICLVLVVAVMPLCAFKCADVPNAPAVVDNRPVMASSRPFVEPVVQPFNQWEFPPFTDSITISDFSGTYVLDFTLPVSDFCNVGNIDYPDLGSFVVNSNQYFYLTFVGNFSLYSYETNELIFSFEFDAQEYRDCRLSFGVNESGSYFFTVICQTVNFINRTVFNLTDFEKYLIVFDIDNFFFTSCYRFYNTTSSSVYSCNFFVQNTDGSASINDEVNLINLLYKGTVFYTYIPPQPTVIETLIDIMISGITAFAENIGKGINDVVVNVFVDTTQETFALTTFGGVIAVFGGLALAVGFSKVVSSFIMRLGVKE